MPPALPPPELDTYDTYRLWYKIDRSGGPDACWPWTGAKGGGYGRFKIKGKLWSPHRLVAAAAYPNRLKGSDAYHRWVVLHTCDNRACCNPAHLRIGTQQENVIDMVEKGRQNLNPRRIYSPLQIAEFKAAEGSSREIAARYGVSHGYVRALKRGARRSER